VLGEGNIIFFIYVLKESIVYTVQCFAFEWALVNQPAIILADEPCADLDAQDSNIIPEHKLEDDPRVKTNDSNSVSWKGYKKYFNGIIYWRNRKIMQIRRE
jgi:ABC-type phosphate/phosphonate transport system ATPase subunit